MSNEILEESFFSNKNIPTCEKVGLIALLLGGTYEKTALSFDKKGQSFFSLVCKRGGGATPVAFTFGHPESMSPIAAKAMLLGMGISDEMAEKNVSGNVNDKEFVKDVAELYSTNPNIDKTKFGENFERLILPKIQDYFAVLKRTDRYLADNPKIIDKINEICKEVNMGDKKKQVTEQVTQTMTNNSQNN